MVYGSDGSGRCDPDPLLVANVYLVTARTSRLPTKGAVFVPPIRQLPPPGSPGHPECATRGLNFCAKWANKVTIC